MKNGRQIEYLQLVTSHQASVYGYIRSLAPNADIEDILQETNIVLWNKMDAFQLGTDFKSFAFRIAHLKTLEALRATRRKNWLVFDTDLLDAISARQVQNTDEGGDLQQAALRICLRELERGERELIHSRYSLRQSVIEIAKATGRTEGAMQQAFFRIRNALRHCIGKRLELEGGLP